jgi:hypothetical protein
MGIKQKGESEMNAKAQSYSPESETADVALVEAEVTLDICPSHKDIAALAYSYSEARGFQGGTPEEDWFRAEQELRSASPSRRTEV